MESVFQSSGAVTPQVPNKIIVAAPEVLVSRDGYEADTCRTENASRLRQTLLRMGQMFEDVEQTDNFKRAVRETAVILPMLVQIDRKRPGV